MTNHMRARAVAPVVAGTLALGGWVSPAAGLAHNSTSSAVSAHAASGPPAQPPGSSASTYADTGGYTLRSGSAKLSGRSITASSSDESGVLVDGGSLQLTDVSVRTSGSSKSSDDSSFFGLDAGILAEASARLDITGASVTTSGAGANGVFAYGSGSAITISDTKVKATGNYAHGIMASSGGKITATGLTISTAGQSSAAVATDRGGGTIDVIGGTMTTSGFKAPGIYSTGDIVVRGATMTATGAEAAVVEGGNSITAIGSILHATVGHGVMLYNSMSGDAQVGTGSYTMIGGALTASAGPAFYVTNTHAMITLKDGAKVTAQSGVLLRSDNAGTGSGNTGAGITTLVVDDDTLAGDLVTGGTGTIAAELEDRSTLTGSIDKAALALAATSKWVVSGSSVLTTLTDAAGLSGDEVTNIEGDGHTVTYDSALNAWLHGKTYKLAGGGTLKPA